MKNENSILNSYDPNPQEQKQMGWSRGGRVLSIQTIKEGEPPSPHQLIAASL